MIIRRFRQRRKRNDNSSFRARVFQLLSRRNNECLIYTIKYKVKYYIFYITFSCTGFIFRENSFAGKSTWRKHDESAGSYLAQVIKRKYVAREMEKLGIRLIRFSSSTNFSHRSSNRTYTRGNSSLRMFILPLSLSPSLRMNSHSVCYTRWGGKKKKKKKKKKRIEAESGIIEGRGGRGKV